MSSLQRHAIVCFLDHKRTLTINFEGFGQKEASFREKGKQLVKPKSNSYLAWLDSGLPKPVLE